MLDELEDNALCQYSDFIDDLGIPIQESTLIKAANSILRNQHTGDSSPQTVS